MLNVGLIGTIIAVVVIVIVFIALYKTDMIATFSVDIPSSIKFLTSEETTSFLLLDTDTYVSTMTRFDLSARKVTSPEDYLELITNKDSPEFEYSNKAKLSECCMIADKRLKDFHSVKFPGFNAVIASNIKWKLAKISNNYENGYPHTRQDIIFLSHKTINSSKEDLIKTLIHEKVHLYQRMYKEDINDFLKANKIIIFTEKQNFELARANPDTDKYIYVMDKNPMTAVYTSKNPKGIDDVLFTPKNSHEFEHPYELQAYQIADACL